MINHSKGLDLEITDFEYRHRPTYTGEFIPSQTSRYVIRGNYFLLRNGVEDPTSGTSKVRPVESNINISDRSEA